MYEVKPPQKGLKFWKRRWNQFLQMVGDETIKEQSDLNKNMVARYGSETELDFYEAFVENGFYEGEREAVELLTPWLQERSAKVLLIGCGAGREAFCLEELGLSVDAVDIVPTMVERAKKLAESRGSKSRFYVGDFSNWTPPRQKYDYIHFTPGILSHLQGAPNRIAFMNKALGLLAEDGRAFFSPNLNFNYDNLRFKLSSYYLKWKWWPENKWEPGDSMLSYLGRHNDEAKLIFYHFFPGPEAFESELKEAGFKVFKRMEYQWIAEPRK